MTTSPTQFELEMAKELMSRGHLAKTVSADGDRVTIDIPRTPSAAPDLNYNRLTPFRFNGTDYRLSHEETVEAVAEDGVPVYRYHFSLSAA